MESSHENGGEDEEESDNNKGFSLFYLIYFISLVLILIAIWMKKHVIFSFLKNLAGKVKGISFFGGGDEFENEEVYKDKIIEAQKIAIKNLEDENQELTKKNESLREAARVQNTMDKGNNYLDDNNNRFDNKESKVIAWEHPKTFKHSGQMPRESSQKIAFLSAPTKDGFFKVRSMSQTLEYHSYYKIIITDNDKGKAIFQIIENKENQKKALNSYDRVIAPVCMSDNLFDENTTQIENEIDGMLILREDIWEVVRKCKIRYI